MASVTFMDNGDHASGGKSAEIDTSGTGVLRLTLEVTRVTNTGSSSLRPTLRVALETKPIGGQWRTLHEFAPATAIGSQRATLIPDEVTRARWECPNLQPGFVQAIEWSLSGTAV